MSINLLGLRRSGTHMVANYMSAITNKSIKNNIKHDIVGTNHKSEDILVVEDINPTTIKETQDNDIFIVVIRDPLNMASSRIKHYDIVSSEGKYINIPMAMAHFPTYYQMYINNYQIDKKPTFYVNFNKFTTDLDYRKTLVDFLEAQGIDTVHISNAEGTLDYVDINGSGSSFDGRNIEAKDMKIHQRYLYYWDLDSFKSILKPDDMKKVEEVFNIKYGDKGEE